MATPRPYDPPRVEPREPQDNRPETIGVRNESGSLTIYESRGGLEAFIASDCWYSIHHDKPADRDELEVEW